MLRQDLGRVLSEIKITSMPTLKDAIAKLHKTHRIPHIIVTSIQLPDCPSTMSIIGSTARSDFTPRLFKIDVPAIDCFFSGTGDLFAALTIVRLREAITEVSLTGTKSWLSADNVKPLELPLARAAEKVLGSMHTVLSKTKIARDKELEGLVGPLGAMEKEKDSEKRLGLRRTKAAEVRIVRCLGNLREPSLDWTAEAIDEDVGQAKEGGRTAAGAGEREGLGLQHLAGMGLEHRPRADISADQTLPQNRA